MIFFYNSQLCKMTNPLIHMHIIYKGKNVPDAIGCGGGCNKRSFVYSTDNEGNGFTKV